MAMRHIVVTTLVSSIMLESKTRQLLCPPVAYFLHYCSTPQAKEARAYYRSMAEVRSNIRNVLPYPNPGWEQLEIKAYLMEVLYPFITPDAEGYVSLCLDNMMEAFREFGSMLLLEPTSREWNYHQDHTSKLEPIVVFPAFRQVRDNEGEPTEGEYNLEIHTERFSRELRAGEPNGSFPDPDDENDLE